MKLFFKYDYKYKIFTWYIIVSMLFLAISIAVYYRSKLVFVIGLICFLKLVIEAIALINYQGVRIKKDKIIIIDDIYTVRKLELKDIKCVEVKTMIMEKKSSTYGLFLDFITPLNHRFPINYVYKNGKVYCIIFHKKNGGITRTYFEWMYKEGSLKKVQRIENDLFKFVNLINEYCNNYRAQNIKIKTITNNKKTLKKD